MSWRYYESAPRKRFAGTAAVVSEPIETFAAQPHYGEFIAFEPEQDAYWATDLHLSTLDVTPQFFPPAAPTATPYDETGLAWFVISGINVSEVGARAPPGYVDEVGRRVFLTSPEAVAAITDAELQAAGQTHEHPQHEEPDPFWSVTHDSVSDVSWLDIFTPAAADPIGITLASDASAMGAIDQEAFWPVADLIAEQSAADIANDTFMPPLFGIHFTLSNTNEGGTDGVTITTGNSGGGSGDAWDSINAAVAPNLWEFSRAQAGGTLSNHWQARRTGDTISNTWNLPRPHNQLFGRVYIWMSGLELTADSKVFLRALENLGIGHVGVGLDTLGRLTLQIEPGTIIDTSPVVPQEAWLRLETRYVRNTTVAGPASGENSILAYRLYFDPNSAGPPDHEFTSGPVDGGDDDYGTFAFTTNPGGNDNYDIYMDEQAVTSLDWLGPSATTFTNNARPSLVANQHLDINPQYPYEYPDEAFEYATTLDVPALVGPPAAPDDAYIAALDLPHDEIGGLYPDDLSDYQPAYDDAPHTLFNDGPLFPDDLVPSLSLADDQAWIDPPPDYTNDQPLIDTALEALFSDGPVATEVNFAQPLMWPDLEVYFPERDYTDETPFLDHVGEAFNDGPLFPDDLLGVLDISWDQAAFPEWDWTNDQPWIDTTIEAFLFPPTADDSYIASLDLPADLDWSTDEHDYYSDVYDETSTILFNDGPLFPDDLLATLDINWDQAAFPDWDYTSDQPIVDGAIEAFIAGPPLFITDDLIAIVSDSVTSDLEVLFPPWDYTNDQQYQDGAAEVLLNDGPIFPQDYYPALDLPDQTDHTPPEYANDQLLDGALEALTAGELPFDLFPRGGLDDQAWDFTPIDTTNDQTYFDNAAEVLLNDGPIFPADYYAALDLPEQPQMTVDDFDQTQIDDAFISIITATFDLFQAVSLDDQTWAWLVEEWPPELVDDALAALLTPAAPAPDELFAAIDLAHAMGEEFFPLDPPLVEYAELTPMAAIYGVPHPGPTALGPRSFYWGMRKTIQGFSPGSPRDQDVKLGHRPRRNS